MSDESKALIRVVAVHALAMAIGAFSLVWLVSCSSPCALSEYEPGWTDDERAAIAQARARWGEFAGPDALDGIVVIHEELDSEYVVRQEEGSGITVAAFFSPPRTVVLLRSRIGGKAKHNGVPYPEMLGRVTMHEFGHALGSSHSEDPRSIMSNPAVGPCILAGEFEDACLGECADICWGAEE